MIEYVAGFCFTSDYKHVLLVEKSKPSWQKGKYNAVGGKLELGESPVVAMHREFYEETGLSGVEWEEFCDLYSHPYNSIWRVSFFRGVSDKIWDAVGLEPEPVAVFGVHCLPENRLNNISSLVAIALSNCYQFPFTLTDKFEGKR